MLSARNTEDVWPLGYAKIFGFLRRVGSRVKRILFPRHYVIAARVGGGPTGVISAPWERNESSRPPDDFFFLGEKAFFPVSTRARDEISRLMKRIRSPGIGIRTYVRTKARRTLTRGSWKILRGYCLELM